MSDPLSTEKSLVLVLGAGASEEVKFPLGDKLKDEIANALNFIVGPGNSRNPHVGDEIIWQCLNTIGVAPDRNNRELLELHARAQHIHDAMPLATSIDNFIDSHKEDARIATCGKLGIARCVLNAERLSTLYVDPANAYNEVKFLDTRATWLNSFFRSLVESCQSKDIETQLRKVGVITFNYDRSLEHFLYRALQVYYRKSPEWASNALKSLEIHHPYGTVGPLPWMGGAGAIGYGGEVRSSVLSGASKQILTFSEGTNADKSSIETIRRLVAGAKRIAFLGFAYHPLNMELLFDPSFSGLAGGDSRKVLGTAFGISDSDIQAVTNDYAARSGRGHDRVTLSRVKCANLLAENQRSLSLVR